MHGIICAWTCYSSIIITMTLVTLCFFGLVYRCMEYVVNPNVINPWNSLLGIQESIERGSCYPESPYSVSKCNCQSTWQDDDKLSPNGPAVGKECVYVWGTVTATFPQKEKLLPVFSSSPISLIFQLFVCYKYSPNTMEASGVINEDGGEQFYIFIFSLIHLVHFYTVHLNKNWGQRCSTENLGVVGMWLLADWWKRKKID